MKKWEIAKAFTEQEKERLLNEGWEPFAVDYLYRNGLPTKKYMLFKRKREK